MIHAYATFQAGEGFQPVEYNPGELGPNDVEVDVDFCGICHSDLSMVENEWGISQYPQAERN